MDTLSLATTSEDAQGDFVVRWQFRRHGAKQPYAGEVLVRLHEAYTKDRPAIAELAATHHLLEEKQIRGTTHTGAGLRLEVSFGSIRKALLKGALKKFERGNTEKGHIAYCASFLATKYFEAEVAVRRGWNETEPKSFLRTRIDVPRSFPRPAIHCHLLGKDIVITRHAMRRQIARINPGHQDKANVVHEDDLSSVPDKWWGTAWRWFSNVFRHGANLRQVRLLPKWEAIYARRYGAGSIYLWHPDTQAVLVISHDRGDLVVATVLKDQYAAVERDPVQAGQRLLPHWQVRRKPKSASPAG